MAIEGIGTSSRRTAVLTLACGLACFELRGAAVEGAGGTPTPDCPAAAQPVELVDPTVLGDGTPGSVTTAQIQAALDAGGHVSFDVGASPVTITLGDELVVSRETVLDGGGLVTLSGGGARRVLLVTNPDNLFYTLTLQNLGIRNGATPGESGAGVFKPSGGPWQAVSLVAIQCDFRDNVAIAVDQDGGGGAIYAIGMKDVIVQDSYFQGNRGSNGGAIYSLGSETTSSIPGTSATSSATAAATCNGR